jgi:predicted NUDIX family NTP pyrophosphohydrolase
MIVIEWPAKSNRFQASPEAARSKILSGQIELIDRLETETT